MLQNLFEIKAINPITKDIETNIGIIKPILNSRIMDLANVSIQVMQAADKIGVKIYDGNILEIEFTIPNLNKVEIKGKKKIKLFTK